MIAYWIVLMGAIAGALLTGRALVPLAVLMVNLAYKLLGWKVGLELTYPYIDGFTLFALILTAPKAPYPETDRCAKAFAAIILLHFAMCLFPKVILPLGLYTDTLGAYAVTGYTFAYCGLFLVAVMMLWGNEGGKRLAGLVRWLDRLRSLHSGVFASPQAKARLYRRKCAA